MKLLVAGCQDKYIPKGFTYELFAEQMKEVCEAEKPDEIVQGGANGIDSWAAEFANKNKIPQVCFPADWKTHGNRAGYIRNAQMVDYIKTDPENTMILFWDKESKGTADDLRLASEEQVPVSVYDIVEKKWMSEKEIQNCLIDIKLNKRKPRTNGKTMTENAPIEIDIQAMMNEINKNVEYVDGIDAEESEYDEYY